VKVGQEENTALQPRGGYRSVLHHEAWAGPRGCGAGCPGYSEKSLALFQIIPIVSFQSGRLGTEPVWLMVGRFGKRYSAFRGDDLRATQGEGVGNEKKGS
jgi:hypothetical protein